MSQSQPSQESQGPATERVERPPRPDLIDTRPHPEWTRLALAVGFSTVYLSLVAVMVIHTLIVTWDQSVQERLSTVAAALLSPLGTLVGGIIGFYFGTKREG